ncbi:MAG TPA: MerR family transcriptional regulator [Streptosporangiaceae bacterium]|nr:MerR family transcriptional regulator [Streptosporangiaceae bacterium]
MSTDAERFTIGQLAERTGVTSRTIRFWSDAGLVPPAGRSATGYRLYDAEAVARLDLVQTLRELGLGLEVVRAVLARATTVAQVAAAHVAVLDDQIRILRLRRAVLKTVATRGNTIEETLLMHKLARLSAQERQQLIDDFVDGVFAGTDPGAPGAGLARRMRQLPADLPDDPTPEQVDAWIELAELIADPGFRERTRTMAQAGQQPRHEAGQQPGQPDAPDYQSVQDLAGQALAAGIAPGSPEGQAVLDRLVPASARPATLRQLETFTDARVERYWQLLGILNGQPPFPPTVPAFEWLIAALRASLGDGPAATGTASG